MSPWLGAVTLNDNCEYRQGELMSTMNSCAQRVRLRLVGGLLGIVSLTAPVQAARAAVLEEITVFAQKKSQNVQSVPQSITAVTGDAAERKGITSTIDLVSLTPNLQVNSAYGETQPNFSLRGISVANEFNPIQASPIGVYVDEAYMSNRISHGLQLFDIERIEVLRGPQGTLYGRNTTGGAISIFTRRPTLEEGTRGFAQVSYGNFDRREAKGALEQTLVSDVIGVRAAVNYLEADGSIPNKLPGKRDSNSLDTIAGRLSVRATPADTTDFSLVVYAGQNKPTSAAVYSLGVDPATGATTPGGVNPFTGYSRSTLGFFETQMENAGFYRTHGRGISLNGHWDAAPGLRLTSITSYDTGSQALDFDADGSPVDLLTDYWDADFRQFNQELRLSYDLRSNIQLILGIYYGNDTVDTDYYNRFFGFAPFGFETTAVSKQSRDSKAAFANLDYGITDKLRLTLGLRHTTDTIQVTDYAATYAGATTIGPDFATPTKQTKEFTGRVALDYHFTDDVMSYVSFSRGYRGGAFNAVTSSGPQSLTYAEPEFVKAYEFGLKTTLFDRKVTLNTALFYDDYTAQQLQELIGAVSYLRNAGKSTLKGFEIDFAARPIEPLEVSASIGYLDAQYDELTLSGLNLNGNEIPFAPKWTGNVAIDWKFAAFAFGGLSANVSANYIGQQFFSPFNEQAGNQNLQEDGYWNVNSNLRFDRKRFYASLWAKNLTNHKHFVYGIDTKALGYSYLVQNTPRTYGVNLGFNFD